MKLPPPKSPIGYFRHLLRPQNRSFKVKHSWFSILPCKLSLHLKASKTWANRLEKITSLIALHCHHLSPFSHPTTSINQHHINRSQTPKIGTQKEKNPIFWQPSVKYAVSLSSAFGGGRPRDIVAPPMEENIEWNTCQHKSQKLSGNTFALHSGVTDDGGNFGNSFEESRIPLPTKILVEKRLENSNCTNCSQPVSSYSSIIDFWNKDVSIDMLDIDSSCAVEVINSSTTDTSSKSLKRKRRCVEFNSLSQLEDLDCPTRKHQKIEVLLDNHNVDGAPTTKMAEPIIHELQQAQECLQITDVQTTTTRAQRNKEAKNLEPLTECSEHYCSEVETTITWREQLAFGALNQCLQQHIMIFFESFPDVEMENEYKIIERSPGPYRFDSVEGAIDGGFPFDPGIDWTSHKSQWRSLWQLQLFDLKVRGNIQALFRTGNFVSYLVCFSYINSSYNSFNVPSCYNLEIQTSMELILLNFCFMNSISSRFLIDIEIMSTSDIDQEKLEFLFCSYQNTTSVWFPYLLSIRLIVDTENCFISDIDQENLEFLFCSCYDSKLLHLPSLIHQVWFLYFSNFRTRGDFKHELLFVIMSFALFSHIPQKFASFIKDDIQHLEVADFRLRLLFLYYVCFCKTPDVGVLSAYKA